MKRIVIALALVTMNVVVAHQKSDNVVRTCKKNCHRHDNACRNECERRSVPSNFGYGVEGTVRGGVQTLSLGILPTTEQGVEEAREGDYNPIRNIGTGLRDTTQGAVRVGTLGLAGRD